MFRSVANQNQMTRRYVSAIKTAISKGWIGLNMGSGVGQQMVLYIFSAICHFWRRILEEK